MKIILMVACLFFLDRVMYADALDDIVAKTQSSDPATRMNAFPSLAAYLSVTPSDPRAVNATIALLILETQQADAVDDDGDYYGDLIATTASLNNPSAIPALVQVIGTGNLVPNALARLGPQVLDPVIARATDPDWLVRKCVMIMLSAALTPPNVVNFSDPVSLQKIASALEQGTTDQSSYVSETAIIGLNKLAAVLAATLPASGTKCNGVFRGAFNGSLAVSDGQTCVFLSGSIAGSVSARGGSFISTHTSIAGSVDITDSGSAWIGLGTTIAGSLTMQRLPSNAGQQNSICGATIAGDLAYQNNGRPVQVGASDPTLCAPNTVQGDLLVINDTAAVVVSNNFVQRNLQLQNDTTSLIVSTNTVGGDLQLQNNGAVQVTNNNVTHILQCQNNSSITGSENTAQQKQGQCASF